MTYAGKEGSRQAGNPVEYYVFSRASQIWYLTTRAEDTTVGGDLYYAATIKRGALRQSDDQRGTTVEIVVPESHSLAQEIYAAADSSPMIVTISQEHVDDGNLIVKFIGEMVSFAWQNGQGKILVASIENRFSRPIPRVAIQKECPHMLYDARCNVDLALHLHSGVIDVVDGDDPRLVSLSEVDGAPDSVWIDVGENPFQFGWIQKNGAKRFIVRQNGPILLLLTPMAGLVSTDEIGIAKGCNKLTTDCDDKFANIERFGGFPTLPSINPHVTME